MVASLMLEWFGGTCDTPEIVCRVCCRTLSSSIGASISVSAGCNSSSSGDAPPRPLAAGCSLEDSINSLAFSRALATASAQCSHSHCQPTILQVRGAGVFVAGSVRERKIIYDVAVLVCLIRLKIRKHVETFGLKRTNRTCLPLHAVCHHSGSRVETRDI
jgi:hypothetical protein